uniref:Glycosyltransferase N-terminal domain-containing protein n=1 Tax=Araucaria cunninghamii TaxID=56994 RepID=A0A0D6QS97_ARACU
MEDNGENKQLHVLMFPWLAHGHMFPFLELSIRLAHHGVRISFLSTPRNISKMRQSLLSLNWEATGNIDLMELPLPSVDGLPPGGENTADIPNEMADILKKALDGLEEPFEHLLRRVQPDYIVCDISQHWAPTVAAKFGIPAIFFSIYSAAATAYVLAPSRWKDEETTVGDLTTPPPGYPSSAIALRPFEAGNMAALYNPHEEGDIPPVHRSLKSVEGCWLIAIRSCYEMEGRFIDYVETCHRKRVVPVGLLLPEESPPRNPPLGGSQQFECLAWLDRQKSSTVVYVSFGSECFLSAGQIGALAEGLELSGVPFLWVLRFPRHVDSSSAERDVDEQARASACLPQGFEERTRERGFVYGGWAPQQLILSHPSTAGFLSHCGWSSVLEAIRYGVKVIGLPMMQGLDARLVAEELKIGVEVARNEEDGSFTAEEVCLSLRKAMVGDEGRRASDRMEEMRHKLFGEKGPGQDKYVREFVTTLVESRPRRNALVQGSRTMNDIKGV